MLQARKTTRPKDFVNALADAYPEVKVRRHACCPDVDRGSNALLCDLICSLIVLAALAARHHCYVWPGCIMNDHAPCHSNPTFATFWAS